MRVDTFTITHVYPAKGSNCIKWNVDYNGRPFGQLWTFKARGEVHRYHAKSLAGVYANFATYAEAESFMRGLV